MRNTGGASDNANGVERKQLGCLASLPARHTHSDRIKDFPLDKSREIIGQLTSGKLTQDVDAFTLERFTELSTTLLL